MIYIFHDGAVEEHRQLPLNSAYPLGTWACIKGTYGSDVAWYKLCKGTLETFWGYYGIDPAIIPNEHRLQLLILGPPK